MTSHEFFFVVLSALDSFPSPQKERKTTYQELARKPWGPFPPARAGPVGLSGEVPEKCRRKMYADGSKPPDQTRNLTGVLEDHFLQR